MANQPGDLVPNGDDPEGGDGVLQVVFDAIATYVGGIPASLKKNVGKAFGQLLKIPGAWIDGTAAEIKANSDARIAITKATAKSIAKQINVDSSLVEVATQTHAAKILRQTKNTAKVIQHATDELRKEPKFEESDVGDIGEDWLNAFEQEAANMSSEHMQRLFGKILAGEIRRPATYSIRTVRLMAQLDNEAAELFRRVCSMACSVQIGGQVLDSRVLSLGGNAGTNALAAYGLAFNQLNVLLEYGLIISDFNSYMSYHGAIVEDNNVSLPFFYMGSRYALMPKQPLQTEDQRQLRVHGVQLSSAGRELMGIVDLEEQSQYTASLIDFFDRQGFTLVMVKR